MIRSSGKGVRSGIKTTAPHIGKRGWSRCAPSPLVTPWEAGRKGGIIGQGKTRSTSSTVVVDGKPSIRVNDLTIRPGTSFEYQVRISIVPASA